MSDRAGAGDEFERPTGPAREVDLEGAAGAAQEFDLFLAYNSQDDGAVHAANTIKRALEDRELKVWFAEEDVVVGQFITLEMTKGMKSARSCALLYGKGGFGRWQGLYEQQLGTLATVERRGFRLFVVLLPGADGPAQLSEDLRIRGALDLSDKLGDEGLTEEGLTAVLAAAKGKTPRQIRESARTDEVPGRNLALLVNVGTYSDPDLKKLHGPRSDVEQLQRALGRAGMPRGKEWKITRCPEPDYGTLMDALSEFFDSAGPHDTVLFYYSGHGVVDDRDSYICATSTGLRKLGLSAISANQIVELIEPCAAAEKVVILDCCHAARIEDSAYETLPDNVAVVVGSRGPTEDSKAGSEPSPFTRNIVDVFDDLDAYGDRGLAVGDLLDGLDKRGETQWTNRACARHILLASWTESSERVPTETRPVFSVEVSSTAMPDDRLPLVRQLAATLDGLLAMAPEERQLPTTVVRQSMQLLASELRQVALTDEQARELDRLRDAAGADAPQTCAVQLADEELADLPWEYLALHDREAVQQALDEDDAWISIERVFEVPRTKRAGAGAMQRVLLFSSLSAAESEHAELLTEATERQLKERASLSPVVFPGATWNKFSSPWTADVVILQAPVRLRDGRVQVLFADPESDEPKPVAPNSILDALEKNPALTWLFIESVAANSRHQSALAVRKLAKDLASRLARPVVAICHSRAYLSCLRANPEAGTFLAHLLMSLKKRPPLDHAAHAARNSVMNELAVNDPAIIGFPIVMRPFEQEASAPERPVARR